MATVRDEILQCLQLGGRQSAREVALALGRNEKLVMRLLRDLAGTCGWPSAEPTQLTSECGADGLNGHYSGR